MSFAEPETNALFLPIPDAAITIKNPESLNRQRIEPIGIAIFVIAFRTRTNVPFIRSFDGGVGNQTGGQMVVAVSAAIVIVERIPGAQVITQWPATPVPRMVIATRTRWPATEQAAAGLIAHWRLDEIPWADSVGTLTLTPSATGVNLVEEAGLFFAEFNWTDDPFSGLQPTFDGSLECDGSSLQVVNATSLNRFKLEFDLYQDDSYNSFIELENQFKITWGDAVLQFESGDGTILEPGIQQNPGQWMSHSIEYNPATNQVTFKATGFSDLVVTITAGHLPYVAPAGLFRMRFSKNVNFTLDENFNSILPALDAPRLKNVKFYKYESVTRV